MLEDDLCDVLRKAQRGTGINAEALTRLLGIATKRIERWTTGEEIPSEEETRAIALPLRLDPGKLADLAARRWNPDIALPADVRRHPQDPHPSNGYVFFLDDGRTAALVDPAGYPTNLLRAIARGPYVPRYILITHKHADHCDAVADIARAFPAARIVMHAADAHALGADLQARLLPVIDNDALPFGENAEIRMLHTPGHTDGSSCFLFRSSLFSGDALFAGSVGGAYGETSTHADIINSVRCKLFSLSDTTVVMPGHGPPTTLGEEKAHNPFF